MIKRKQINLFLLIAKFMRIRTHLQLPSNNSKNNRTLSGGNLLAFKYNTIGLICLIHEKKN